MRRLYWMIGASLAAACALGIPSVSLAAHHPNVHHGPSHHVKHTLLPPWPVANLVHVFRGVYVGASWPTLPGPIRIREENGNMITVSVTDTTRMLVMIEGTVATIRHAVSAGGVAVSVIAVKNHDTWVAEVLTAHLNAFGGVHPEPLPVAPISRPSLAGSHHDFRT